LLEPGQRRRASHRSKPPKRCRATALQGARGLRRGTVVSSQRCEAGRVWYGPARSLVMKSPFPGMDPYLEDPAFWPEFHHKFINYWQEQIAESLPDHYEARLDENIYLVESVFQTRKLTSPDFAVYRSRRRESTSGSTV